jgi:glycosyltransferase involved in cell wall biosynthesis
MNFFPLISIIMPAYNAESYIKASFNSLLQQEYRNWECIIVDDGSVDNTFNVISEFKKKDKRFKSYRFPENKGRPAARQKALDFCEGKYIAMLDSDDIYFPKKLKLQVQFLEANPKIGFVSSKMIRFNDKFYSEPYISDEREISFEKFPKIIGFSPSMIPHAPSMVRSNLIKTFIFDLRLKRAQDLDLMLYLANKTPFALIKNVLYGYRMNNNIGRDIILEGLKYQRLVIRKWSKEKPTVLIVEMVKSYSKSLLARVCYSCYLKFSGINKNLEKRTSIENFLKGLHL